ncbi:MAG: thiamine phosphate synthase [Planctomycetota bacterium]
MGIFTPHPLGPSALDRLVAAAPFLDVVQVRVKAPGRTAGPSPAAALFDWTVRVLDALLGAHDAPLVVVNDRPDVARATEHLGCAGVHVGQDDAAPDVVRRFLGERAIVGLSTHDARQVARAEFEPVDYLGFGPVFPTATKGYERGVGPELAWSAHAASPRPVFPIGGIDLENALELDAVGRAAVGSAIFAAPDPARAAAAMRALLEEHEDDAR